MEKKTEKKINLFRVVNYIVLAVTIVLLLSVM